MSGAWTGCASPPKFQRSGRSGIGALSPSLGETGILGGQVGKGRAVQQDENGSVKGDFAHELELGVDSSLAMSYTCTR